MVPREPLRGTAVVARQFGVQRTCVSAGAGPQACGGLTTQNPWPSPALSACRTIGMTLSRLIWHSETTNKFRGCKRSATCLRGLPLPPIPKWHRPPAATHAHTCIGCCCCSCFRLDAGLGPLTFCIGGLELSGCSCADGAEWAGFCSAAQRGRTPFLEGHQTRGRAPGNRGWRSTRSSEAAPRQAPIHIIIILCPCLCLCQHQNPTVCFFCPGALT
jgi:hypothetical protein